ncbi:MAG: hypothetical protein AB1Z98_06305 [Nannocystaceae bacterium]
MLIPRPTSAAFVLCSVLALSGCPGDDGDPQTDDSSSTGSTTAPATGSTTAPATSSTTAPATDSTTSGSSGSSSDGADSGSSSSDGGESSSSSGGMEICEVNLPPPPACPAMAAPPPVIVDGPWPRPSSGVGIDLVADDDPELGGGFIMDPDGGGIQFECSTFDQDCDPGEKCMPWANDGGSSWNATRCSPVAAMPGQVGDPCMVEGSGVSGIDDCDIGTMCWDVDTETNQGTCAELCGCSEANPTCDTANTTCAISNDGALAICLPVCNPLDTEACPDGEACYPLGDVFLCAPDASGDQGSAGDPCQFINACDAGLFCLAAVSVPGCAGSIGCCSPGCTIGDDSPCLPGQSCEAWYEAGAAPDACLGSVGACVAP